MAESVAPTTPPRRTAYSPYLAVLRSRIQSQRSYKANFRIDLASSFIVGLVELAEVWVLFYNVDVLGGFTFPQILLVFGMADVSFSFADMVFGHCDRLPTYIRAGTLDVFYLRPQPLLLQLVTSDISLRRLTRALVGVVAVLVALNINDIAWDAATVGVLALSLISGFAVFSAMFVWAAGCQFFLINGAEMTNAFVYGGRYAATQPASVWNRPLKVVFGFFFPMAFTGFIPAMQILGLDGPEWLPAWLSGCTPLAALWTWGMALLFWRIGVRHYQGGGG